jgi:hypothetical protein
MLLHIVPANRGQKIQERGIDYASKGTIKNNYIEHSEIYFPE